MTTPREARDLACVEAAKLKIFADFRISTDAIYNGEFGAAVLATLPPVESGEGERMFKVHTPPVGCPTHVPWRALNEGWAMRNHSQTLELLNERGGLCPEEIFCNVKMRPWADVRNSIEVPGREESIALCVSLAATPPTAWMDEGDINHQHGGKLRPSVVRFARLMETQLRRNDSRGGWNNCDRVYFMEKLEINLRDLGHDLRAAAHEAVQRDCADLGNFAMMMAENEFFLHNVPLPTPPQQAPPVPEVCPHGCVNGWITIPNAKYPGDRGFKRCPNPIHTRPAAAGVEGCCPHCGRMVCSCSLRAAAGEREIRP